MEYSVFGLPRSRTTWLSAFLSLSGTFCYHEGIDSCFSWEEYENKVDGKGDSTTGWFYTPKELWPEADKRIIINKTDKEFDRCIEWCKETYPTYPLHTLEWQRDELKKVDGHHIFQSDLELHLDYIWETLFGKLLPAEYKHFTRHKITCTLDYDSETLHELLWGGTHGVGYGRDCNR